MRGGEVVAVNGGGGGGGGGGPWRWIILDSSGEEIVVEAEKYAIMRRVQIHARDLRILNPLLSYPSAILARHRAIILNLEHIKAIITSEEVLVRDPLDEKVIPILEELRRRLMKQNGEAAGEEEQDDCPFEFRALEVLLEATCSFLSAQSLELSTNLYPALDMLTSKTSGRNLERIRKLKSQMTRLTARVQKVRDELAQLLDDDEDMADLYLSRKKLAANASASASPVSMATTRGDDNNNNINNVEELEMLLESYFMQIDATFTNLTTLREYIENTEDYINIQLDTRRNQLIQTELVMITGTICLAIYSLVTAIFGMNIPYTWNEKHGYIFKWVNIYSGIFCLLLFVLIMAYARVKGLVGS